MKLELIDYVGIALYLFVLILLIFSDYCDWQVTVGCLG